MIRPLVRRPSGKQPAWPQTYERQRWVRTATAWNRLDVCLLTPLQQFAQATVEKMRQPARLPGQSTFRLPANDPALAYLGTPIANVELLLYVVYAGDVQASLWSKAARAEIGASDRVSDATVEADIHAATERYIEQVARIVSQRRQRDQARSRAIRERARQAEAEAQSPVATPQRNVHQAAVETKL